MPRIDFPYGKERLSLQIVRDRLSGVLLSQMHSYAPPLSQNELVKRALENPIGTAPLRELAKGKDKIVIIASDHTQIKDNGAALGGTVVYGFNASCPASTGCN